MNTNTAPQIKLSKTAPWATADEISRNSRLRNGYRERFAYVDGIRFRIYADALYAPWWVEVVDADGEALCEGGEFRFSLETGGNFVFGKWAFRLSEARRIIADYVASVQS